MKRPWGAVQKLLPRLGNEPWGFIGCSSFEERCIGAANVVHHQIGNALCFRLDDLQSRFTPRVEEKTDASDNAFNLVYGDRLTISRYRLLGAVNDIILEIREFLDRCGSRIIVDMSCLPKRVLCLVLKEAIRHNGIRDIFVTYTIPDDYTKEPLVEDLNPLSDFPAFSPDLGIDEPKRIIASLGYTPFDLAGLQQQLGGRPPVSTLFPFPPGAPRYQRNWQLLLNLFGAGEDVDTPIRVDAADTSYCSGQLIPDTALSFSSATAGASPSLN